MNFQTSGDMSSGHFFKYETGLCQYITSMMCTKTCDKLLSFSMTIWKFRLLSMCLTCVILLIYLTYMCVFNRSLFYMWFIKLSSLESYYSSSYKTTVSREKFFSKHFSVLSTHFTYENFKVSVYPTFFLSKFVVKKL